MREALLKTFQKFKNDTLWLKNPDHFQMLQHLSQFVDWLNHWNPHINFEFTDQAMTPELIEKLTQLNEQILQREVARLSHEITFEGDHQSTEAMKAFQSVRDSLQHLSQFISFCQEHITNEAHYWFTLGILFLMLDLKNLSSRSQWIRKQKALKLFVTLFNIDEARAKAFYEKHQPILDQDERIRNYLAAQIQQAEEKHAVQTVNKHLDHFQQGFAKENEPLSFAPLMTDTLISDVEPFVAYVLYLLQRGIEPENILKAGLLHEYFNWHFPTVGQSAEHNAIHQLYRLLGQFDQAKPLVQAAQNISCGLRGHEMYTLDGQQRLETQLLGTHKPDFDITIDQDNVTHVSRFVELYPGMRPRFWFYLFKSSLSEYNVVSSSLQDWLNSEELLSDVVQLTQRLVGPVGAYHNDMIKRFIKLIETSTWKLLVEQHPTVFVRLTPYQSSLLGMMSREKLIQFIQETATQSEPAESLGQLTALLEGCIKYFPVNSDWDIRRKVYKSILDILLDHEELHSDDVISCLERHGVYDAHVTLLEERYEAICNRFKQCLQDFSYDPIDHDVYHKIEGLWLKASRQVALLTQIKASLPSRVDVEVVPKDKYALHAAIAKTYLDTRPQHFSLEALMATIHQDERERSLIEILLSIEDAKVIQKGIAMLNRLYPLTVWLKERYGHQSILQRTVDCKHITLIKQLSNQIRSLDLEVIVLRAHSREDWQLVSMLCKMVPRIKLSQKTVNIVSEKLIRSQQWDLLLEFCNLYRDFHILEEVDQGHIGFALVRAAKKGKKEIVRLLCNRAATRPSQRAIDKAFKVSCKRKCFEIMGVLINDNKDVKPSRSVIDNAFIITPKIWTTC